MLQGVHLNIGFFPQNVLFLLNSAVGAPVVFDLPAIWWSKHVVRCTHTDSEGIRGQSPEYILKSMKKKQYFMNIL